MSDIAIGRAGPLRRVTTSSLGPEIAIARRTFKQLWMSAVIWGVVFGATVASSALTYVSTFPDEASRQQIAATTGQDAGISILLGPITSIDTVGGYTVYKAFVTLTTIGAIWALLAATRLLRGEEDSGRWQLTLSGGTRPSRATAATLTGLGAGVAIVFLGTTLFTVLAGRNPDVGFSIGDSIIYGLSIAIAPAVFAGVGGLTSQLGRSRRVATGLGMAVFGVCFVIRMMADSSHATKWLLWLTPFGWTERMRPFTENDLRPLLLAAIAVGGLGIASTVLAGRRDVGAGVFADRDAAPARSFGLRSPFELTLRLELPVIIAWFAGVAAAAFFLGIIAKVATGSVPESMTDLLDKFGVQGTFLRQYLGVAFLMIAAIVSLLPASQIGASAEEETSGRLVHVIAQPVRRGSLMTGRLALAAVSVAIAGVLAGVFAWAGARVQGVDPGFATTLKAGLNVVPTALLVLGFGAVVRCLWPRFATTAMYGVVAWSFIADLLASLVESTKWLGHLSIFHCMALAPAAAIDLVSVLVTLVAAVVLLVVAVALFARRDVQTG